MLVRRLLAALVFLGGMGSCYGQSMERALFVTNYASDDISSFTVNHDGTLDFVGVFETGDSPQTISLSPDGKFLAVGHGTVSTTTEQLRIFQVNGDASLTGLTTALVPDSPLDAQWLANDLIAVTETDFSQSFVRVYRYDSQSQSLVEIDSESSGAFNTQLEFSPSQQLLFANSSFGVSSVRSYQVDSSGLTPVDTEPTEPLFALGLKASPDGKHLYGAGGISGDDRRILGFDVADDGQLAPLPQTSFTSPGASPKVLSFSENDDLLVAGHGGDGSAHSFLRDPVTGALTSTGFTFSAGDQGDLGDLTFLGDVMFVTDTDSFGDGSGIYSVRVEPDGSFTQLGPKANTMGNRPEYLAVWDPTLDSLTCDFDADSDCDLDDLNLLLAEGPIMGGIPVDGNERFDLDGNGVIDNEDRSAWLELAAAENGLNSAYLVGDANLDGVADVSDFNLWNANRFSPTTNWNGGDFNGDGVADVSDFGLWNAVKFTASDRPVSVPEPTSAAMAVTILILFSGRLKKR